MTCIVWYTFVRSVYGTIQYKILYCMYNHILLTRWICSHHRRGTPPPAQKGGRFYQKIKKRSCRSDDSALKMNAWNLRICLLGYVVPWLVVSFEVLPFGLWRRQGTTPLRTKIRSPLSSSFSQVEDADTPTEENDPVKNERSTRQHWLDLRGTAIRPGEALAFFVEFLAETETKDSDSSSIESIKDLIDCIIVPEETFREIPEEIATNVDLLVVDKNSIILRDGRGDLRGTFIADDSTFVNPLDSLDLYNRGDWILFEYSHVAFDSDGLNAWVEQIGSLLQLLPATAAPQSMEAPSGLILPSISKGEDDEVGDKKGGVGICCPTRQAVFRVDALLEQAMSSAGVKESAESGILLLADANDVTIPITSALILPFDLNLWRAVVELREETR